LGGEFGARHCGPPCHLGFQNGPPLFALFHPAMLTPTLRSRASNRRLFGQDRYPCIGYEINVAASSIDLAYKARPTAT
jgi:hypothetical protein